MALLNTFKTKLIIVCFLLLTSFAVKAQYASVDSLNGFFCYKFGDTTVPKDAEIRITQNNGKFIVYHIDSINFCDAIKCHITLSYYEGKLYRILLDLDSTGDLSILNVLTQTFGKYDKEEVETIDVEVRKYYWTLNRSKQEYLVSSNGRHGPGNTYSRS